MELSKLNISSIAKEEIRRRFFDSRYVKNKTSSDSLDSSHKQPDEDLKTSEKEMSEKEVDQVVPRREEETSTSEDDGFPLITSVFSLALPSSGTADEGCAFTDKIGVSNDRIINTEGTPQSIACTTVPSSDVSSCNQGNLPFVVKCSPNGVITVCSPPNPTSSSCKFREDHKDATTITSSLKGSVCSTESSDMTPGSADQQMFPDNTADTTIGLIPNMVTFIDATQQTVVPVEKPRSEVENYLSTSKTERFNNDDAVCLTHTKQSQLQTAVSSITNVQSSQEIKDVQSLQTVDTNLPGSVKTSSSVLSSTLNVANDQTSSTLTESSKTEKEDAIDSNTPHHTLNHDTATHELSIEEECIDQSVPTKQEEKIRHLKDLLRQKEAELEKFRFKGKAGSDSAAAQLRANFLKKNPSLCRRSQRLNTNKISESNSQISTTVSSNKNNELNKCDKNELTFKKKKTSSETELYTSKMKVSDKADVNITNTSSKQKSTKFTDQGKYKLVNVTILQGHTRTLAVPLNRGNIAPVSVRTNVQNKPSLSSKVTETTTRKRKQQMPRKIGSSPSKRKSNSEEDAASGTNSVQGRANKPVQILTTDSSDTHCKSHCFEDASPTGPNTRSSPGRREGHQSLQTAPVKRKFTTTNELEAQNGSSAPEKLPKVISCSLVSSKAGLAFTKPKEIRSTELATTSITQPSAILTSSTTSKSNITLNLKDTRQVTTSGSTSGQKVAYVLHVNGAGAATNKKSNSQYSDVSNEDIVKRVVESMSKEVFALVGKVPGDDDTGCIGNSKLNNSPVTSPLPGSKVILQRNPAAIANQSSQETTPINSTSATNISVPPASCKVPVPTLRIVTFRNELAKVGILKVDIPVNIGSIVNNQTLSGTTTSQLTQQLPISSRQNNQVVQNLQGDTTVSSHHLAVPLVKNITTDQPKTSNENTIVSVTGNGTSANTSPNVSIPVRLGAANSQITGSVRGSTPSVAVPIPVATGNLLKPLTVSTIAPEVKSVPSTLVARTLALKPKYTLTVPFAIASSASNTNNVPSSPTKNMANANPTSRPIAPKPTTSPYTSHRLLAPKPTPTLYTSPTLISPKPATTQNITPVTASSNPITPDSTSSLPVAAKPTSTQYTSPKNVALPSQNIAARSTTSAPLNQVINILPKPVMTVPTSSSSTLPENLNNGKILVYDVVQSNLAQVGRNTPLASKDAAKLVVYVSNTGDTRNLGIIKDKKIYLNSNQVAAVTHQPKPNSPVTTSTSEFIPNPQDGDFKVLLGLEHVVKLLTKD